ncbi:MAG: SAM hydrolase/SAM-dependent halogenase family protein [Leptospirales bacterium]
MVGPLVTLTTDFGTKDTYISAIKGLFISKIPTVRLVDITHEIPSFEPMMALPFLVDSLPWFPSESFHLIVIDPGVGSGRKAVAIQGSFGWAVLPDNGLPALLHEWLGPILCYQINMFLIPGGQDSPTFQARDLFAPALIKLALGDPPDKLGERVDPESLFRSDLVLPKEHLRIWNIDRFGNVLLGYKSEFPPLSVSIVLQKKEIPFVKRYQDVPKGEPGLLINSSGWLELFCREGSASRKLNLSLGETIPAKILGGKGRTF